MTRFLMTMALVLAAGVAGVRSQTPPETRAPLRIQVVAVDRSGNPVTDLKPDEFEVWINIFQVPIETVTVVSPASERPRTIVLLLDDIAIDGAMGLRVKDVARRFVTKMAPADEMAVVSLNGVGTKVTGDKTQLLRAIDRYNAGHGGILPFDAVGQHVLTTIAEITRQFSEVAGAKTIVGIGASWLFDLPVQPASVGRDVRKEWVDAMRAMSFANASLYVIDPGGVGASPVATSGATGFARETGGHSFGHTNDTNAAVDRILLETANYYVLDVNDPPVGRKADLRELDVRVKRRGVSIRAKQWIPGVR
jgi:VWFA-related protein